MSADTFTDLKQKEQQFRSGFRALFPIEQFPVQLPSGDGSCFTDDDPQDESNRERAPSLAPGPSRSRSVPEDEARNNSYNRSEMKTDGHKRPMSSVLTECPPDPVFESHQLQRVTTLADKPIRVLRLERWFTIALKISGDTTCTIASLGMFSIRNCHGQN